jgi:histidine decarboxylase
MANHYVHSDAALAGVPAALLDDRPGFDLTDGCDSISVSGQEFIGTPFPCGAVVLRRSLRDRISRTDTGDTTETVISGTRNGHAALVLWYALRKLGLDGLRERAEQARDLAAHLARRLTELGWSAWHHPQAFIVLFKPPPADLAARWRLATVGGWSRVVCLPGNREQVDRFLADLIETTKPRVANAAHPAASAGAGDRRLTLTTAA